MEEIVTLEREKDRNASLSLEKDERITAHAPLFSHWSKKRRAYLKSLNIAENEFLRLIVNFLNYLKKLI